MSFKELVDNWLEEGFSRFKSASDEKVSYDNSMIPYLKNSEGRNVTPRPLFPTFVVDVELDPNFLVEYLEVIENSLRNKKEHLKKAESEGKNKQTSVSKDISSESKKIVSSIEYKRKNIFLSKTVFSIFELPDFLVPKTSPQYEAVLARNDLFKNSLSERQSNSYEFHDESTLVGYAESDSKIIETTLINFEDKQCLVSSFHIKTHYNRPEFVTKIPLKSFTEYLNSKTKFQNYNEFLSNASESPAFLKKLRKSLYVIEKSLNYNTYKNTLLSYNNCPTDLEDAMHKNNREVPSEMSNFSNNGTHPPSEINLKHHLEFYLTSSKENYNVTCMECNPKNPSIFISGYGVQPSNEMNINPRGMILCWNIHKSEYPEKAYSTEEAVACVAFSKCQPFLVAVGMRYGLIDLYDLRNSDQIPRASNRSSKDRPTGTIVGIKWKTKSYALNEEIEILLTISTDGLITTWNIDKTLTGDVLFTTKRGISSQQKGRQQSTEKASVLEPDAARTCLQMSPDDPSVLLVGTVKSHVLQTVLDSLRPTKRGISSQQKGHQQPTVKASVLASDAAGTCLQMCPDDQNVFLIGTVEGQVLQATFDSPEEYTHSYECHNGPTYDLQWSPLVDDVFVTCGGDRRVRVWEVGRMQSSKTITLEGTVSKLALSNTKSTVFVALSKEALFVFDLSVHMHKPVVELKAKEFRYFTCAVFCPRNNWILVGDSGGVIDLYELVDVPELDGNQSNALKNTFLPEY